MKSGKLTTLAQIIAAARTTRRNVVRCSTRPHPNAGGPGRKHENPVAAQTVMIYIVGSDLESGGQAATFNIRQMLAVRLPKSVNPVLATGGSLRENPDEPVTSWRSVRYYAVRDGALVQLADHGKQNMTHPATASDFIVWGQRTFPARSYHVIFWDHGAGYAGFAIDENFPATGNGNRLMSLPALHTALCDAHERTGKRLDLIRFDACLMASVEVASALAPYADYLVASQELEPGEGWNYAYALEALVRQPSIATLEWARVIADGYLSYHTQLGNKRREAGLLTNDDGFLTMSVIDLKRVRDINLQLELTSPGLEEYVQQSEQNWVNVARERASSTSFGGETTMQNGAFDIVDLGVFADRLAEAQIQPEDYRQLSSAIRRAVVYRANGKLAARTSGLGAYFPSRNISLDTMTQTYSKLGMPKQYKSLLRTYAAYTNLKPAVIQLDLLKSQPGALQAKITSSFGVSQAYSAISVATGMSNVVRIVAASPVPLPQVLFGDIGFRLDTEWAMLNGRPVDMTPRVNRVVSDYFHRHFLNFLKAT